MNSIILEIENALVAKVKELLKPFGFNVEPFPDNPASYIMSHPKGAALVMNKGSQYKAPETTSKAIQQRELTFDLTVLVKNLRSHQGAYEVIDALAYGLAGWKMPSESANALRATGGNGANDEGKSAVDKRGAHPGIMQAQGARLERDGLIERRESVWAWRLEIAVPIYLVPLRPEPGAPRISQITGSLA